MSEVLKSLKTTQRRQIYRSSDSIMRDLSDFRKLGVRKN